MVTYFNEKDMISFGQYLLSDERKQRFQESYKEKIRQGANNPLPPEESLKFVHHADVENWKHNQRITKISPTVSTYNRLSKCTHGLVTEDCPECKFKTAVNGN